LSVEETMENSTYERARKITDGRACGRHTFFQLKHFVLGKELTTQAKLQKCVREIDARKNSLKSMILGLEDAMDEARLLELKQASLEKKKSKNQLDNEHRAIQSRRLRRKREMLLDSIEEMRQKIKETEEETEFFIRAFEQLEQVEPLRTHDDPEANAEFWNENFMQDLRLRLMLGKPIDLELVKCILALGAESPVRKEVVGILEQIQRRALPAGTGVADG
jgi:DNA repair exonuclease SbcCD ATPase subunit